ncbi:KinB-signaling pathway activation protein [Evansella clarkii]|uniref:KinB-signaling pathway activation protein n=1 Tax=Evansella clarkii TaxID=79879 RepID=UPI000B4542FE|nr:KinB-signaling pathway activation protein [Evansella clarkii]
MNTRKVVFLFYTTFLIGTIAGSLMGFVLDWRTHLNDLMNVQFGGIAMVVITASIWTVIAQMGFFAYLTIHRFGLGIFKSVKLWSRVQIVLIGFALFDLMFFRHMAFAEEGQGMLGFAVMPLLLLGYGLIVAYFKSKDTHWLAFIPTLFFIVVVTMVEWIPALRENDMTFLLTSIVPLLVANTWQVLVLHRLHEPESKPAEEKGKKKGKTTKNKSANHKKAQPST